MLPSPSRPSVRPCSSNAGQPGFDLRPGAAAGALPAAARTLPGQRQGEGEDVFGDGVAVAARGDGDPHAGVGGGVDVDVVAADAVPGDDLQPRASW